MLNWKVSIINRRLNLRRYLKIQASSYHDAVEYAKRIFPGYDEVEWCRSIA